jgi:hypothetical protein
MSFNSIILFIHVTGAIGYFVSIGTLLFALVGLRRAQYIEQVRALIHLTDLSGPFGGVSALFLLATGFYMALTSWSLQTSWILVALISLLLMVPASAAVIAPRRGALDRLVREAPDGALSEALLEHTHDPILLSTPPTVTALLLGMVFLMTTKPDLTTSIIVMVVALVLGLASGVLVSRSRPTQEQKTAAHKGRPSESVG